MIQKTLLSLFVVLAAAVGFAACSPNTANQTDNGAMLQDQTEVADPSMEDAEMPTMNIVELAQSSGSFTTLLAAAEAAGLVEALSTAEVTLFAPTDEAFAALPEGTVEALLQDPEQLSAILQYHVVAGTVTAAEVISLPSATTLQGSDVTISTDGAGVMINDATVLQADVMASNGVIHVIDSVLLPTE